MSRYRGGDHPSPGCVEINDRRSLTRTSPGSARPVRPLQIGPSPLLSSRDRTHSLGRFFPTTHRLALASLPHPPKSCRSRTSRGAPLASLVHGYCRSHPFGCRVSPLRHSSRLAPATNLAWIPNIQKSVASPVRYPAASRAPIPYLRTTAVIPSPTTASKLHLGSSTKRY
jgi:hypothetical protein